MTKEIWDAHQICLAIQNEVDEIQELVEDCATVRVALPYWHEPDSDGCNWGISTVTNGASYIGAINSIIGKWRLKVLLKER